MTRRWQTSRRELNIERPLVMAIMNVTPDSFSDGGELLGVDAALRRAEKFVAEGADILDIGGESTRPGSARVSADDEIARVVPVVEGITKRFDIPISVDTSKADVSRRGVDAGAEIINDISALRFDSGIADVAAASNAGLILMHSRGDFETMHSQSPVDEIISDVIDVLRKAIDAATTAGVGADHIALDVGIGFGKTQEQNLELLAKLDKLTAEFPDHPILVGTSRKSFIGKLLGGAPVDGRLGGSLATAAVAVWNGANIVRVHDVKETVETIRIVHAIREQL